MAELKANANMHQRATVNILRRNGLKKRVPRDGRPTLRKSGRYDRNGTEWVRKVPGETPPGASGQGKVNV